ncbi:MAG: ComEC family competence protein, partial [Flavobacterium sp.]
MLRYSDIIFIRLSIPFILGIVLALIFPIHYTKVICFLFTILSLLLLIIIDLFYISLKGYRFKSITGSIIAGLCFFSGGLVTSLNNLKMHKNHFSNENAPFLRIVVDDEPVLRNEYLRFKATINAVIHKDRKPLSAKGRISILLKIDDKNIKLPEYGSELIINAVYSLVEPPFNPGEFDFQYWLAMQNIQYQALTSNKDIIITEKNKGNIFVKYAIEIRQRQLDIYRKYIKDIDAYSVAATLILGYRADLSKEIIANFSKTGTIHALSVSGAHVAIIYFFLDHLLFYFNRKKILRIFKVILICLILWGYALLTGFSPSVLRAVIMLTVFIIARSFSKNTNSYNILSFSALILLIYNPFFITDVGFQLSYFAVFGLLYVHPLIYNMWYIEHVNLNKLWNVVAFSLAAQLITFPLSIYYFHQFPLFFLLGNLFILLPVNIMMALGTLGLIPGLEFMLSLLEWTIIFTNSGLKLISELPYASVHGIFIDKIQMTALLLLMIYRHIRYPSISILEQKHPTHFIFGILI